jgi:hypothetical protein
MLVERSHTREDGTLSMGFRSGCGSCMLVSAVTAPLIFLGCGQGSEQPLFTAHVDLSLPALCTDVKITDVDSDGRLDLVAAIFDADSISILLNTSEQPNSDLLFAEGLVVSVGDRPVAVAVGDLNGDQKFDVVVVNRDSNSISVFINNSVPGDASLLGATEFATNLRPVAIAVGDINGDGLLDVAVASQGQQLEGEARVSIFVNAAAMGAMTPAFLPKFDIATGSVTNSIVLSDINGDGKLDISGANLIGNAVVSLNLTPIGASVPDFAPAIEFTSGSGSASVAVVDVTGDDRPDVVVANLNTDSVAVLVNRTVVGSSSPDLEPKVEFDVGEGPVAITGVDVNLDGKMDIASANLGSSVSLLINELKNQSPVPSLSASSELATAMEANSISVGDINGDGKADLVTGNRAASLSVLLAR